MSAKSSKTKKKKKKVQPPKFQQAKFVRWCKEKFTTSPFKDKPAASSSVLVKVALGLYDKCWKFIASKFAESKKVFLYVLYFLGL